MKIKKKRLQEWPILKRTVLNVQFRYIWFLPKNVHMRGTVVVAQLVVRSLPIPEVPVRIQSLTCYTVNFWKDENKDKRGRNWPIKKSSPLRRFDLTCADVFNTFSVELKCLVWAVEKNYEKSSFSNPEWIIISKWWLKEPKPVSNLIKGPTIINCYYWVVRWNHLN